MKNNRESQVIKFLDTLFSIGNDKMTDEELIKECDILRDVLKDKLNALVVDTNLEVCVEYIHFNQLPLQYSTCMYDTDTKEYSMMHNTGEDEVIEEVTKYVIQHKLNTQPKQ